MVITKKKFKSLMKRWSDRMIEQKDYLIEIDSVVGDADLGLTMSKGFKAACDAIKDSDESDIGKLSYLAGKAMSTAAPSTMGTLLAQGFINAGKALKEMQELNVEGVYLFFQEFYNGVQKLGGANPGEKTFLDGMTGTLELLKNSLTNDTALEEIAELITPAAHDDLQKTTAMVAKHGRAATRGEASRGLLDPGAVVANILLNEFANFIIGGAGCNSY